MSDRDKLNFALTALDNMRVLMDLAFDLLLHLDRDGLSEEAMSDVSKTESLCLASRAYADSAIADGTKALATMGVTVEPETADPMLSLVREYQSLRDGLNGIPGDDETDKRWAEIVAPIWDTLTRTPPAPNSSAGAAAAIRLVRDESNGSYSPDLIRNVLTVVADALESAR